MAASIALTAFGALVGVCAASFATTAAIRSLADEQALTGRSHCDSCGVSLGFATTLPLISYVASRGACRHCRGRIDPVHPVGELVGLLLGAGAAWLLPPASALLALSMGLILLAASIIDLSTRRLPDVWTLFVALLALGLAALKGEVLPGLAAALLTFLGLEGLRRGFQRLRGKAGLGLGDVKLLSALALWLGAATPWAISLAAASGLLGVAFTKPSDGRMSFGPCIAVGAMVVGLVADGTGLGVIGWPL